MFGKQSKRQITSYESGEVDAPASLLYLIWRSGNSVDGLFEEKPISESGKEGAKQLFAQLSSVEAGAMDEEALSRAIEEIKHVKASKVKATQTIIGSPSGQRKERHSKARPAKKH